MTQAREMLAQVAEELGFAQDAEVLRNGRGAFIQVAAALLAIERLTRPAEGAIPREAGELRLEWRDGPPPKPWSEEWFIAITTYGDRVVLRALPEEYTYDFKTADETHIKADRIKKWMQFPDSEFIAPALSRTPLDEAEDAGYRAYADHVEAGEAITALAQAALAAWKALPEDERNGERPYIMGFNDGWEEGVRRAAEIARTKFSGASGRYRSAGEQIEQAILASATRMEPNND